MAVGQVKANAACRTMGVGVADGFLGRWSQRKAQVRAGIAPAEPEISAPHTDIPALAPAPRDVAQTPVPSQERATEPLPPMPTLEDAQALRLTSDFKPFVARGVDPVVRNVAMKKLFADPHFNVMDRMDVYIDDYSLPDPLSASSLRQMASAHFLKLFDDEATDAVSPPSVSTDHADPDLQLQQDPAPEPPGPGDSTQ